MEKSSGLGMHYLVSSVIQSHKVAYGIQFPSLTINAFSMIIESKQHLFLST